MFTAIIVAAGKGSRMGAQELPKQFVCVRGIPIVGHTLKLFDSCTAIDHIVLVIRSQDQDRCKHILAECDITTPATLVEGGKERQDSVYRGLQHVPADTEIVLIQDAVRMFVTHDMLLESVQAARQYGASIVAVPAKDTIKQVKAGSRAPKEIFVEKTLDRRTLWQVQTPQTFQYRLILDMYHKAQEQGIYGTDDAMLAEYFGYPVKIIEGNYRNIKITTPDDLLIAEAFFQCGMTNEQ